MQKLPAGHASHAVAPLDAWYEPAAHAVQLLRPSTDVKRPGAHSSGSRDWARQYEPASHASHPDWPGTDWYVPSAQPEHRLALPVEKLPAAHSSGAVLPAEHAWPSGQSAQSA
tara:strand:- start:14 stop:352 length:339 start_codon:yes stop_codon:yes gene_type:complete